MGHWQTKERQAALVSMFAKYGNRCLAGHLNCPVRQHYVNVTGKAVKVARPIVIRAQRHGVPIYQDGKPLLVHTFRTDTEIEYTLEETKQYQFRARQSISYWAEDDSEAERSERLVEAKCLHSTGDEFSRKHRRYDAVARERYSETSNSYQIEGITVCLYAPYNLAVKLRVAGTSERVWLEIASPVGGSRRSKKRFYERLHKLAKARIAQFWASRL